MTKLVDGKKIAREILDDLKSKIIESGIKPRLAVFMVGDDAASLSYTRVKQKRGGEIGINVEIKNFPETIAQEQLLAEIKKANSAADVSGILIQLPLPQHLDRDEALDTIDPKLDVDCLTAENRKLLIEGRPRFVPPAAAAVMKILEYHHVPLAPSFTKEGDGGSSASRNILIVGSGDLIGKPLSAILLNQKVPFQLANRHTENLNKLTREADIILTGAGARGLITGDMIKQGAIIIDAGTSESDYSGFVGDVDTDSVMGKASLLSPVPGGVGPVTVAMLLQNVVESALQKKKRNHKHLKIA